MATRSSSKRILRAAVLLVGILGCERSPTEPSLDFKVVKLTTSAQFFFFLPPVGKQVNYSGVFDPAASPEVRICEVSGSECGIEVAHMTTSPASGDEMIVLDVSHELYLVNWH